DTTIQETAHERRRETQPEESPLQAEESGRGPDRWPRSHLGKYGSPESYEKYHRLLAERYARGPVAPPSNRSALPQSETLTVAELILGYYRHGERYYVKNGKMTNQVLIIRLALRVLKTLYGSSLVKDFSPLKLEACQGEFVRQGLARREVNRRVQLIRQA